MVSVYCTNCTLHFLATLLTALLFLGSSLAADVALIVSDTNKMPFYLFRKNYSYLFGGRNTNFLTPPHKRRAIDLSEYEMDDTWAFEPEAEALRSKRVHGLSLLRFNQGGRLSQALSYVPAEESEETRPKRVHGLSLLRFKDGGRLTAQSRLRAQRAIRDKRVHHLSLLRVNGKLFYPQNPLSAASEQQKRFDADRRRLLLQIASQR